VKGQISDNQSWSVQGKYTFNFGGGSKDGDYPAQLTLFGGYENISQFNSNQARSAEFVAQTVAGGYVIGAASSSSYLTARILQIACNPRALWPSVRRGKRRLGHAAEEKLRPENEGGYPKVASHCRV
jgi:hypothetical protein